jgi:hypothetical protein
MKKATSKQTSTYIGNLPEDSVYHIGRQIAQAPERSRPNESHDTYIPEKESVRKRNEKYQNIHVMAYELMTTMRNRSLGVPEGLHTLM